ncbi:MAG TPA: hypothetical protein GXX70_00650 [Tepidimicrobium sp.]|nr:hypothetical protein [Tepidimicrobium sp.]
MERKIGHGIFIILFLLITIFGLIPIFTSGDSTGEKLINMLVMLFIYGVWLWLYMKVMKKLGNK